MWECEGVLKNHNSTLPKNFIGKMLLNNPNRKLVNRNSFLVLPLHFILMNDHNGSKRKDTQKGL